MTVFSGGRLTAGSASLRPLAVWGARRWGPVAGAAALLATVAVAATFGSLQVGRVPLRPDRGDGLPTGGANAEPTPTEVVGTPPPGDDSGLHLPGWLTTGVAVLCGLAVAVVVAVLLWYIVRNTVQVRARPLTEADGDPAALAARAREVVAALDVGLADLSDTDADPRRAVIACWVRLEQAAAAAGTRRLPGETPTDLVRRLLTGHRVSGPVLDGFAAVYREARYATHVVDEQTRAAAVSALRQLRSELAAPVADAS